MPCYCSDLRKIKHDRTSLKSALKTLQNIKNRSKTRTSYFNQVATNTKASIAPASAGDPSATITKLNANINQNVSSLITKVTVEIDNLEKKYTYLSEQDYSYHHPGL